MAYENLPEGQEKKFLLELQDRLKGSMPTEMYEDLSVFKRFIRARNYNVDAAELMLRNHLKWRTENKIDSILFSYKPCEVSKKYIPISNLGVNSDGYPVLYCDVGMCDTRGILKSVKKSDVISYVTHYFEGVVKNLKDISKKEKKDIDQVHFIFDFNTFSLMTATHKPTLEIFASLLMLYDRHYPENLKQAYAINASYYFQVFYTLIKPFLTGRTLQKIVVMTKDNTMTEMPKRISPKILPAFLGGQLTDPDGDTSCKKVLNINGPVPETYFMDRNMVFPRIIGATKLFINRMSKAEVKLIVLSAGCSLEWEFEIKSKDISFSLLYKESENSPIERIELIPSHRVETEIAPETGVFNCEKRGVYILEFDNTYSWIHPKEVYYRTTVVKNPVGQIELIR